MDEGRAEQAARESYGKLLALLVVRLRDVAAAEDALSEAFAAALKTWPRQGVPDNPEAWLFTAARRRAIDDARRQRTAAEAGARLQLHMEELDADMAEARSLPDRRLALMFACAHPALDVSVRTALMLQTVLGLSAERIAAAFLTTPAAMGRRLVRAKTKIRESGISFALPEPEVWPSRLPAVLEAIYAAYAEGWSDAEGADPVRTNLASEAVFLARLLAAHAPQEPEAQGLLALLLHLEARRPARRDGAGAFVPLTEQDPRLWRQDMQREADGLLQQAVKHREPGRFQLEAAIQSAHAARGSEGATDWAAIATLYEALAELIGSPVARLNSLAARAHQETPATVLQALDRLSPELSAYQPFWALKAHLLRAAGDTSFARAAYDRAIALERDHAVVAFLTLQRDGLTGS